MKKILTNLAIIPISICALMLILSVLGVPVFGTPIVWRLLVTFAIVGVASAISLNSVILIEKKNIIAIISLILLGISSLLAILLLYIDGLSSTIVGKLTLTISFFSILFNIVSSNALKIGKNKLAIQLLTYIAIAYIDVIATLAVFGVEDLFNNIFIVACIIAVTGSAIVSVLSKKYVSGLYDSKPAQVTDGEKITISLEEYNLLKEKAEKYDNLISHAE